MVKVGYRLRPTHTIQKNYEKYRDDVVLHTFHADIYIKFNIYYTIYILFIELHISHVNLRRQRNRKIFCVNIQHVALKNVRVFVCVVYLK